MDNTQLPAEVSELIEAGAHDLYAKMAENAEDERDTAYAKYGTGHRS